MIIEMVYKILYELRSRFEAIQNHSDIWFSPWEPFPKYVIRRCICTCLTVSKYLQKWYSWRWTTVSQKLQISSICVRSRNKIKLGYWSTKTYTSTWTWRCLSVPSYPITCLNIPLRQHVSVASNERSFCKLKLIETYVRNLTKDQLLTNLSIINIEHEIAHKLTYDEIIKPVAAKSVCKIKFWLIDNSWKILFL